jgi:hypothetical protein
MTKGIWGEAGDRVIKIIKDAGGWISRSDLSFQFNGDKIEILPDGTSVKIRGVPWLCVFDYKADSPITSPVNPELSIAETYVSAGILRKSSRKGVKGYLISDGSPDNRRKKLFQVG